MDRSFALRILRSVARRTNARTDDTADKEAVAADTEAEPGVVDEAITELARQGLVDYEEPSVSLTAEGLEAVRTGGASIHVVGSSQTSVVVNSPEGRSGGDADSGGRLWAWVIAIVAGLVTSGIVAWVVAQDSAEDDARSPSQQEAEEAPRAEPLPSDAPAIPHRVVNTGPLGLFVRICDEEDCRSGEGRFAGSLGTAEEGTTMYVVCDAGVGWVPPGMLEAPWYQVRWPNDFTGINTFLESAPDAPFRGFAYSAFLESVDATPVAPC